MTATEERLLRGLAAELEKLRPLEHLFKLMVKHNAFICPVKEGNTLVGWRMHKYSGLVVHSDSIEFSHLTPQVSVTYEAAKIGELVKLLLRPLNAENWDGAMASYHTFL